MDIGLWGWIKFLLGFKKLKVYYNSYKQDTQHYKNINYWFPEYEPFDKIV